MGKAKNKKIIIEDVATKKNETPAVIQTEDEIVINVELEDFAKSMFPAKSETEEETNATNPFIDVNTIISPLEMDKDIRKMFVKILKDEMKKSPEDSEDYNNLQETVKFITNKESLLDNNARSQINLMLMNQIKAFDSIKNKKGGITERSYETFEAIAVVTIRSIFKPSNLQELVDGLKTSLSESFDEVEVKTFTEILEAELGKQIHSGPVIPKTPYQHFTNRDRSIKLSLSEKRRQYGVKYPC